MGSAYILLFKFIGVMVGTDYDGIHSTALKISKEPNQDYFLFAYLYLFNLIQKRIVNRRICSNNYSFLQLMSQLKNSSYDLAIDSI